MLVPPYDQIQEIRQEVFREIACFGIRMTNVRLANERGIPALNSLVLMHAHQIEPITLLQVRLKELDLAVPECAKQALVSDIAEAIQRELRAALLEEHWLHGDVVRLGRAPVVVDKPGDLQQVQRS